MPTPNLKLLLHALRLGQPQDPQAAIFALAEALTAQDETIEELKRRLAVVQSAANILETKASRLEGELEVLRHGGVAMRDAAMRDAARSEYQPPASVRPEPMPASSAMPALGPGGIPPYQPPQPPRMEPPPQPPLAPPPPERPRSQFPPPMPPPPPPPERPRSQFPPPTSGGPSALGIGRTTETPRMPNRRAAAMGERRDAERSAASVPEMDLGDEDSSGDFRVETVVVSRKDLDALVRPEAPFRIAPPGQGPGPDRGSIPGAPWARGMQQGGQRAAPVQDDFTMDAMYDARDEGDDEDGGNVTHPDLGKLSSLATALGLSPDDPRIQALKSSRPSRPRTSPASDDGDGDSGAPTKTRRR